MKKKLFVRCIKTTRDGSRCGRMAPADTQICAVHTGVARSPVIPPDGEIDEIAILKKLAKDTNPQVRLRAVDLLLSLKSKASSEARDDRQRTPFAVSELTDDERTTLSALVTSARAFKHAVLVRLGRADVLPDPVAEPPTAAPSEEPAPSVEEPQTVRVMTADGPRTIDPDDLGEPL
jgi:hypothetical protein